MEVMIEKVWSLAAAAVVGLMSFVRWHYTKMDTRVDIVVEECNKMKVDMATSKTLIRTLNRNIQDLSETVTKQNDEIKQLLIDFAENRGSKSGNRRR